MNVSNGPPGHRSAQPQPAETELISGPETDTELDAVVRAAVARSLGSPSAEEAVPVVTRLADLRTIQRLMTLSDPLPTFSNFEVLEELGRGGMGTVYKAKHRQLGKLQAIKVIRDDHFCPPQDALLRFKREARAVAALCHPNIVAAHDANFESDPPYFVMDYVDGESLAALQKRLRNCKTNFPVAAACEAIRQAAVGLQCAHEQNIIHRDIKPGNLMLDRSGTVRVLDLGLARVVTADRAETQMGELTTEQQVIGTPDYMSPEQLRSSRDVDARADVYALGATLYCLLAGQPPFASSRQQTFVTKAASVLVDPIPDIRRSRPDIPRGLAQLLIQSLQKDAGKRMPSAAAFAERLAVWARPEALQKLALSGAADGSDQTSRLPATAAVSRQPPRFRWPMVALASFAGFLFLAAVVFRLALPGGAYLEINCEQPDAQIVVSAVQGKQVESFVLSQRVDRAFELTAGRWMIAISGVDADRFELSTDQVVLSRGNTQRVSIQRVDPARQNPVDERVAGAALGMQPAITPAAVPGDRPRDVKALLNLNAVDWQPGPLSSLPGYASSPAKLAGIDAQWQIIPKFAHATPLFDVSPRGTYLAMFDDPAGDPYVRIADRQSGRLMGIVQRTGYYGRRIAWAADESRILIHFITGADITAVVCRLDGSVMAEWTFAAQGECAAQWSPEGDRILFVTATSLHQFAPDGQLVARFVAPEHGGVTNHEWASRFWSPDGRRFAVSINGELRFYDQDGGQPLDVLKDADGLALQEFCWHPGGDQVMTNGQADAAKQERKAARLWTFDGKYRQYGFTALHETFATFSPDGQFFLTTDGDVRDLKGKSLAKVQFVEAAAVERQSTMVRWTEPNRTVWFSSDRGAGYSAEYSPAGKKLQEIQHPLPVWQDALSWMESPSAFTSLEIPLHSAAAIATHVFRWNVEGTDESAVVSVLAFLVTTSFLAIPRSERPVTIVNGSLLHPPRGHNGNASQGPRRRRCPLN